MKIQTLSTKYPAYIQQFYVQHPELATASYQGQHSRLMADSFGSSETRAVAFQRLNYESELIFGNIEPLQKKWAQEHGVRYCETNWIFDIAIEQIKAFQPVVLFLTNYSLFDAIFLKHVKETCPSIRLVLGWCGAPYKDATVFKEYDIVLSNIPELVRHFQSNGHCSFHINHAFDERILQRIDLQRIPDVDFAFIGSIIKGSEHHNQRETLLLELVQHTPLALWSEIDRPSSLERLSTGLRRTAYDFIHIFAQSRLKFGLKYVPFASRIIGWQRRPGISKYVNSKIARRAHAPLFGLAMFQKLHDSRVSLNTHIDISSQSASNMRLFEATGVGTCLLTDWKSNLSTLFVPDTEVVTYRSAEECIEKVNYLLAHEAERRSIAQAGQKRTLKDHTVIQRAEEIQQIICDAKKKSGFRPQC